MRNTWSRVRKTWPEMRKMWPEVRKTWPEGDFLGKKNENAIIGKLERIPTISENSRGMWHKAVCKTWPEVQKT